MYVYSMCCSKKLKSMYSKKTYICVWKIVVEASRKVAWKCSRQHIGQDSCEHVSVYELFMMKFLFECFKVYDSM